MNDLLQPGHHLDPDQLNAFVEGVLPDHERIQTLAHLADCPHCRQIVFLAQQAQQSEEPVPVKAAPGWRDWFRFNPLSMVGAASAALACALIATVALHLHHSAPPPPTTETAKVEPVQNLPPAPKEEAPIAAPSAPARPAAKAVPPPAPAPQSLASSAPPANPIQDGAISAETSTSEDNVRVHTQLRRAEPPAPAPSPAPPYVSSPSAADALAGASVENLPVNGRAFLSRRAEATGSITQTLPAKAALHPLPSKLPIATTLSSGASILAADSAGTLFVSKNGGESWQAVEQQWQGKVTRLALAPQAEAKDATDNRVVAPSSFQLTTEAGVIWISEDGVHWRQQ